MRKHRADPGWGHPSEGEACTLLDCQGHERQRKTKELSPLETDGHGGAAQTPGPERKGLRRAAGEGVGACGLRLSQRGFPDRKSCVWSRSTVLGGTRWSRILSGNRSPCQEKTVFLSRGRQ